LCGEGHYSYLYQTLLARACDRKFLGYSFWVAAGRQVKRRIAPRALEAFKERI